MEEERAGRELEVDGAEEARLKWLHERLAMTHEFGFPFGATSVRYADATRTANVPFAFARCRPDVIGRLASLAARPQTFSSYRSTLPCHRQVTPSVFTAS